MGHLKKRKSTFDEVTDDFGITDGHDTIVHETDLRAIDKKAKSNANIF